MSSKSPDSKRDGSVSRRRFVQGVGATGVAATLAGCGGGGGNGGGGGGETSTPIDTQPPEEDITVQFASDTDFKEAQSDVNDKLHELGLPENISIEVLAGAQVTDQRRQKYQQWLDGGRSEPTLLMMDSGWTIPFIARNQLQNLSQSLPGEITSTVNDSYFEASVSTAKGDDGDLYGIPLFPDFPTMQYRKDWVEDAGYDPDGNNWATESITWKRFAEVTKDVKEQAGADMGYTFQAQPYEGLSCCDFNEFMTSWGGAYFGGRENLFGPVNDRPITVDEKPVLDSIRMIRTFIHGEQDEHSLDGYTGNIAPQAVLQMSEEPSRKPFTNGKAVMHRNWPYAININGADDAFGENLGVMPIPYGVTPDQAKYEGTGGPVAALGGWHATMNPNATEKKKQAAVQVLKAMQSDEFMLWVFGNNGWIPPKPDVLSSDQASQIDAPVARYLEPIRIAGENAIPRPVTIVWPQQSTKIANQVNASYAQEKSPEDAMSELKNQLKQIEQSA